MSSKTAKKGVKSASNQNAESTPVETVVEKHEHVETKVEKQEAKPKTSKVAKVAKPTAEEESVPKKTVTKSVKVVKPASEEAPKKKLAKSPRPSSSEEVVEAKTDVIITERPKRKLEVTPGEVTVLNSAGKKVSKDVEKSPVRSPVKRVAKKVAAKKTAKKSPAKATSRSPARSPKKSPSKKKTTSKKTTARKSKAATKTGGRKTAAKKGKSKSNKAKRPHNVKPTALDDSGIGIGPAKVKKVLMHVAFNPVEYAVRQALHKAENKPIRPKPTPENPNPEMPPQDVQTPVDKLDNSVLKIIHAAEAAHQQSLVEDYESSVVARMKKENLEQHKEYTEARKKASEKDGFNLRNFNTSHDSHFYDGLDAFCAENDSYSLDRMVKDEETGEERERFNQWTRAMALVNKMCIRLSSGVRDILACFLDNLVIQYARNGIHNCVAEKLSNLQLRHALSATKGFDERVPLDKFARSLYGHELALDWIEACQRTREEIKDIRHKIKQGKIKGATDLDITMPEYPDPEYDENFEGYVVEICRSVRMQMASEQKVAADKAAYHNIKISEYFKKFCSIIIYESILRIGDHLKETIALKDVKTVNETLMYHSLRQLCKICGIDFASIEADMKVRLEKFKVFCNNRREKRRNKRKTDAVLADVEETEEVDQEEQDAEQEEQDDKDIVAEQEEVEEEEAEQEDAEEAAEEEVEEDAAEEEVEQDENEVQLDYEDDEEQ
jgi:hypothetical protein